DAGRNVLFAAGDDVSNTGVTLAERDVFFAAGDDITHTGVTLAERNELFVAGDDIHIDGLIDAHSGDVNLFALDNSDGSGLTRGDVVRLRAFGGDIGDTGTPFRTRANTLIANAGGSAYLSEFDDVTVGNSSASGDWFLTLENP